MTMSRLGHAEEHTRPAIRMISWRKPSRGAFLEDIAPAIKVIKWKKIEQVCCRESRG
jgi:hypothetical protein